MKFAYHGENKVGIEADTTRRVPVSSKPPPPKPPITYSSYNPVGKGAEKGKWKTWGKYRLKRDWPQRKDSKGKDDSEGKEAKGDSRGGNVLPKVEEEDLDATSSRYFTKTEREENWESSNRRNGPSYRKWKSGNGWDYFDGTWEMGKNLKTDEMSAINGETRHLGFGEFSDWTYAEVPRRKQSYVQFLLGETEVRCPEKKNS